MFLSKGLYSLTLIFITELLSTSINSLLLSIFKSEFQFFLVLTTNILLLFLEKYVTKASCLTYLKTLIKVSFRFFNIFSDTEVLGQIAAIFNSIKSDFFSNSTKRTRSGLGYRIRNSIFFSKTRVAFLIRNLISSVKNGIITGIIRNFSIRVIIKGVFISTTRRINQIVFQGLIYVVFNGGKILPVFIVREVLRSNQRRDI